MNIGSFVLTIMSVVTLAIGVYLNRTGTENFQDFEVEAPEVLSEEDEQMYESSSSATPSSTPQESAKPSPISSSAPTSTPNNVDSTSNLDGFIFPGASVKSKNTNTLDLTSSSNPNEITSWYKNKFSELKLNSRAAAQTNTNGNIENKLAAANSSLSVEVEIVKGAQSSITSIKVFLK